jgi:rhodanese-related sulfurtransferase
MSIREIQRASLQKWLSEGGVGRGNELAVLDLRDESAFAKGHPLFATNLPLRRLVAEVTRFVPRKSVRLVLVDDGSGQSAKGAAILGRLGYADINILKGGIPAWLEGGVNGLPTFDIPGVIFTVAVADQRETPAITVQDLAKLRDQKQDVIVLDTRTIEEFTDFHVPGARSLPGGELVQRFLDYVPSPDTFVVVSCAGLPRAIIGAQTLIDIGVPNRVAYLYDGTSAWKKAGWELESGLFDSFGPPSDTARHFADTHIRPLADSIGVRWVDQGRVNGWLNDEERTTYLLDVRLADEFRKGHVPGSVSAPGGQLLAVTHRTVATRGARLVLIDDTGVRAITVAHWLQQRGWEVYVLEKALEAVAPPASTPRGVAEPAF